jgi:hypothetical protein
LDEKSGRGTEGLNLAIEAFKSPHATTSKQDWQRERILAAWSKSRRIPMKRTALPGSLLALLTGILVGIGAVAEERVIHPGNQVKAEGLAKANARPNQQQSRIIYQDEGGNLHQVYNKGTGQNVFMWQPKGGKPELVHDFSGGRKIAPGLFYRTGDELAGLTGTPEGSLNYHLFTRTAEGWQESISSPMGSASSVKRHEWISVREMRVYDRHEKLQDFVVTDIPLVPSSPDSNARLILLNGQPYQPRGWGMSGAIWDQPLEKILADHEARLKAAKVKEPQKSAAEPTGKTPASEKPGEAVGK